MYAEYIYVYIGIKTHIMTAEAHAPSLRNLTSPRPTAVWVGYATIVKCGPQAQQQLGWEAAWGGRVAAHDGVVSCKTARHPHAMRW